MVFFSLCDRAWGSDTAVEFEYTNAIWQYGTMGEVTRVYIRPIDLDWL